MNGMYSSGDASTSGYCFRYRLGEFLERVSEAIEEICPRECWLVAEIAKVNRPQNGHTYFELVEKLEDCVVGQVKGTLWRSRSRILDQFERVTGQAVRAGMEVLLYVKVEFHPVYGLSLDVQRIDPNYTLGDMARRRQEIVDQLAREGLLHLNKECYLPLVPQRVAVVSSETAAGLEDFMARLEGNAFGYRFCVSLFPAAVQGEGASASIREALARIRRRADDFDCVILLRGGGGTVDLSCFDAYDLCRALAEFPMPVLTGIGHERDRSVADQVAFFAAATPTAAAEYLIAEVRAFDEGLSGLAGRLQGAAAGIVKERVGELDRLMVRFVLTAQTRLGEEENALAALCRDITAGVRTATAAQVQELARLSARLELYPGVFLQSQASELRAVERDLRAAAARALGKMSAEVDQLERDVRSRDPRDVLRRGYSITRRNGRAIRAAADLVPGDELETTFFDGYATSVVKASDTAQGGPA